MKPTDLIRSASPFGALQMPTASETPTRVSQVHHFSLIVESHRGVGPEPLQSTGITEALRGQTR